MAVMPAFRSWRYLAGNFADPASAVASSKADPVILDLEDMVPPAEKLRARAQVAACVAAHAGTAKPALFVRPNRCDSALAEADISAVVRPGLAGFRLPKIESAEAVLQYDHWVARAEAAADLPVGELPFVPIIESALGIHRAQEVASAHPRVVALAFGSMDFASDINARQTPDQLETLVARSHLVLASRLAGIRPPVDGVYFQTTDLEGLARSSTFSRALGFTSRAGFNEAQIEVINTVYAPSAADLRRARDIVSAAAEREAAGVGAFLLADGYFVDIAVVRAAEAMLSLAASLGMDEVSA